MNITRENLIKKKIEILENIISKEEMDIIKEKIKEEVNDIIFNFNKDNEDIVDE